MKKLALCLVLSGALLRASAQLPADTIHGAATLQECIRYALDHQPAIQQAAIDEEITQHLIRARLADWLPQVGGNYSLQHNFQRQTSFFNGVATPVGVTNTSAAQLSVNQAIFNRDVLLARRTQGDVRLQSTQTSVAVRIGVIAGVRKAFYDILTTQQQIRVATENSMRLQKSLDDAYYRYLSGVTDKTDYKRAQIALNNTTATRQSNEAALAGKLENLKDLIGYPPNATLDVVYDSAQMEREVGFDTTQRPDPSRRIEYQLLQTEKRLQEANVLYQRNAYLPNVSANAAYNFNFLSNNLGKLYGVNYPTSYIGLTAGIPIFQGGRRKENLRAARLQVTRLDLELGAVESDINREYALALSNYRGSLANYRAARSNVALAQEVYDVIQLQYRAGIKAYLEVISAETDLRTAQINYFNALNQVLASKVDAERALGLISDR